LLEQLLRGLGHETSVPRCLDWVKSVGTTTFCSAARDTAAFGHRNDLLVRRLQLTFENVVSTALVIMPGVGL